MTTHIRLVFIAILVLSLNTPADAANNSPLPLTLPQAVQVALSDNPDLALSKHRLQSANISVEAARGRFVPSLQGMISSNEQYSHQSSSDTPEEYQDSDVRVTASLNLFNGFADQCGLDVSRQHLQATDADFQRQKQIVAFTVASRYVAVLIQREQVRVAAQNLKSQQKLQEQIEAFYQAGTRAITDYYQQQSATAQAEFSLIDAQRNLQIAKFELLQTLGVTLPGDIEILPVGSQALIAELKNPDPARNIELALSARPDIIAQQLQITGARQQIKVAKAGYFPSVDLQASAGTTYSSTSSDGGFADQLNDNHGASIGLVLSIPIFDRDQTRTNVAEARINEADERTNLAKLQQQISLEVSQAITDYQRARLQRKTTDLQVDYARLALAASEARYQVGAATWVEISTARTVFVQAQSDQIRSRFEVLLQGLTIGYARGDLATLLDLLTVEESSS